MKVQLRIIFVTIIALTCAIGGCYYDNEEDLYISLVNSDTICDTVNVTYTKSIAPICASYCNSCHDGSSSNTSGYRTDTYQSVKTNIDRIIPAINHTGPSPMPKGGGSLSVCDLNKFNIWKRIGMPE